MSSTPHDLPSVAQSVDPAIREPLTRVIQAVRLLSGFSRDPYARALTIRDAQAGEVLVLPGITVPIGSSTGEDDEPDLTPPPTVTGLSIVAGFTQVIVQWDPPSYTEGRGHLRTNIYAAKRSSGDPLPTFATAEKVYSAPGALTIASLPSELNTIWHVWAKWETVDNVESTNPAGGTNGVTDTTGQDVSQLMEVLTGQITESQLHTTLGTRIDLIDDDASVPGSVNYRIGIVQTQVNELLETPAYDNGETYAADDMVTYAGGLYRALGPTTGNLPTNPAYWEKIGDYASLADAVAAHSLTLSDHEARIYTAEGAITAEASSRSALAVQIRGAYTGTDLASLTTGLLYDERVARATAVSAEVTARQSLSSTLTGLTDPTGATLASLSSGLIFDERTARSTADGTLTTQLNSVSARLNSGGDIANAIVTVQTTANTAVTTANGAATTAGTAQTTANSTATQLTTLQSSIAGAGGNLLPNSSFEVDTTADGGAAAWALYSGSESAFLSQVAGRTGGLAQRVSWAGTNTGVKGVFSDSNYVEGGIAGGVRGGWQPNKSYVVSAWVRAASGAAGALMSLHWNVAPAATVTLANPALSSSAWQRYAWRITTGATVEPYGRLYITIVNGSAVTGYIDIDDAMVQEGELLTGYVLGDQPTLTASLQQEVTTRASQTGALFAQWTVKTDLNGYVSGFGLASTATTASPTSAFIVRADSFSVSNPAGPAVAPATPFIVRTTPTTENGVTVPVGVYMDAAYIANVSALYGRFGTLIADSLAAGQINAANLTLGTGVVGGNLRSTTFTSGSGSTPGSGWRLTPAGALEASGATIYGTIYAAAGVFAGALSAATGTFAGSLSAATGTFAGALSAATGTFAGALSAATGTFGGTYTGFLNASQVNAGALRGINVNAGSHTTIGSYLTATTTIGDATVNLQNTDDFSGSGGTAYVFDTTSDRDTFTYTGKTSTTLTGCVGVANHTVNATVVPLAKSMVIDAKTSEMRFLGNRGDGTITELISLGATAGLDAWLIKVGSNAAGNTLTGIHSSSYSSNGLVGISATSGGVVGGSGSSVGVYGSSGSGSGVEGISTSGYGGQFSGNATRANLRLLPLSALPSSGQDGDFCSWGGNLYYHNGAGWQQVQLVSGGGGG